MIFFGRFGKKGIRLLGTIVNQIPIELIFKPHILDKIGFMYEIWFSKMGFWLLCEDHWFHVWNLIFNPRLQASMQRSCVGYWRCNFFFSNQNTTCIFFCWNVIGNFVAARVTHLSILQVVYGLKTFDFQRIKFVNDVK